MPPGADSTAGQGSADRCGRRGHCRVGAQMLPSIQHGVDLICLRGEAGFSFLAKAKSSTHIC
jgi:hypothetical protein